MLLWRNVLYFEHKTMDYKAAGRTETGSLRIRPETRPDHFGWLLHAFAKFGQVPVVFAHAAEAC